MPKKKNKTVQQKKEILVKNIKKLEDKLKACGLIGSKKNLNILGFDPGLKKPGYCILSKSGKVVDAGLIDSASTSSHNKIKSIHTFLTSLNKKHKPCLVLHEAVTVSKSFHASRALSYSIGALYSSLEVDFVLEVSNTSLKKFLTSNHLADKNEMIESATKLSGFDFSGMDDAADAYAAARFASVLSEAVDKLPRLDYDVKRLDMPVHVQEVMKSFLESKEM